MADHEKMCYKVDGLLKGGLEILVNLWRQFAVRPKSAVDYELTDADLAATTNVPDIRSNHACLSSVTPYLAAVPGKRKRTSRSQTLTYLALDLVKTMPEDVGLGAVLLLQRSCYLLSRRREFCQAE